MDFFQDVKILNSSPLGGTLSRESRVWDFRLFKPQPEKEAYEQNLIGVFTPSNTLDPITHHSDSSRTKCN